MNSCVNAFKNSINIPSEQKSLLNQKINNFLEAVIKELDSLYISYNLYLSGSLSRGEPSVICWLNGYKIVSDVDLVMVIQKSYDKMTSINDCLKNLERKFIEFDFSILVIDVKKLSYVQSSFGRDLIRSFNQPIKKMFDIKYDFKYVSNENKTEYFECFIYQIIKYLFYPLQLNNKIKRDVIEYTMIKLILESFKIINTSKDVLNGYFELYKSGDDLTEQEKQINEYVLYREVFNIAGIKKLDFKTIVLNNLKQFFGCNNDGEMLNVIIKSTETDSFFKYVQFCILTLFISYLYDNVYKDKYYTLFTRLILKLNDYIKEDKIKNLTKQPIYGDNNDYINLLSAITFLKDKYIKELYKKNTGI